MQKPLGSDVRYYRLRLLFSVLLIIILFPITSHSYDDVNLLALNIYHEARGEDAIGIMAIALVTLNRLDSPSFPNTLEGVVTQRKQFSWYGDKKPDYPKELNAYNMCYVVSELSLMVWHYTLTHNIIKMLDLGGIKWYHNKSVTPSWSKDYDFVGIHKNHLFYRK